MRWTGRVTDLRWQRPSKRSGIGEQPIDDVGTSSRLGRLRESLDRLRREPRAERDTNLEELEGEPTGRADLPGLPIKFELEVHVRMLFGVRVSAQIGDRSPLGLALAVGALVGSGAALDGGALEAANVWKWPWMAGYGPWLLLTLFLTPLGVYWLLRKA